MAHQGSLSDRSLGSNLVGPLLPQQGDNDPDFDGIVAHLVVALTLDVGILGCASAAAHLQRTGGRALKARFVYDGMFSTALLIVANAGACIFLPAVLSAPLFLHGLRCALRWTYGSSPRLLWGWLWTGRARRGNVSEIRLLQGYLGFLSAAQALWQLAPASWNAAGMRFGLFPLSNLIAETPWINYAAILSTTLAYTAAAALEQLAALQHASPAASRSLSERLLDAPAAGAAALGSSSPAPALDVALGTAGEMVEEEGMLGRAKRVAQELYALVLALVYDTFSGLTGLSLALGGVLVWVLSYPSILQLPVLLYSCVLIVRIRRTANYKLPRWGITVVIAYLVVISVVQWAAAAYSVFRAPEAFLEADISAIGFQSSDVTGLFSPWIGIVGITPRSVPALSFLLQFGVLGLFCIYQKVCREEAHSPRQQGVTGLHRLVSGSGARQPPPLSRSRGLSGQPLHEHEASDAVSVASGASGADAASTAGTEASLPAWFEALWHAARFTCLLLLSAVRELSYVVVLVVLYVLTLGQVDIIHAGYLVMFIVAVVSPLYRERYWRVLVCYTALAVTLSLCWHLLAYQVDSATAEVPSWVIVLPAAASKNGALPLWDSALLSHVAILALSGVQLAQYEYQDSPEYRRSLNTLLDRAPWIRHSFLAVIQAQLHYGVYVVYAAVFIVGSFPPVDVGSFSTLCVGLAVLLVHMLQGASFRNAGRKATAIARMQRLRTGLGGIALLQATILLCKYTFQFPGVRSFISDLVRQNTFFTVQEAGFATFEHDNLYVALVDNTLLLLVVTLQARALDTALQATRDDLQECLACCRRVCAAVVLCRCSRKGTGRAQRGATPPPPAILASTGAVSTSKGARPSSSPAASVSPRAAGAAGAGAEYRSTRRQRGRFSQTSTFLAGATIEGAAPFSTVDAKDVDDDSDSSSASGSELSGEDAPRGAAGGPDCSPAGCRRGWGKVYRAAAHVHGALFRLVVSFLFYHSGKLTLLAAFSAACLQPNAWGLVVLLIAVGNTTLLVYRTDESVLTSCPRCCERGSALRRGCACVCPCFVYFYDAAHANDDVSASPARGYLQRTQSSEDSSALGTASKTYIVKFRYELDAEGDLAVTAQESSPHMVVRDAAVRSAALQAARLAVRREDVQRARQQAAQARRLILAAGGSEAEAASAAAQALASVYHFQSEEREIVEQTQLLVSTTRALKLPRRPYRDVWWVFLLAAVLGILPRYVYQFTVFHDGRFWPEADRAVSDALGFPVVPHPSGANGTTLPYANAVSDHYGPQFLDGMWAHVLGAPMLLLAFVVLQRASHDFEADVLRWEARQKVQRESKRLDLAIQIENLVGLGHKWLSVALSAAAAAPLRGAGRALHAQLSSDNDLFRDAAQNMASSARASTAAQPAEAGDCSVNVHTGAQAALLGRSLTVRTAIGNDAFPRLSRLVAGGRQGDGAQGSSTPEGSFASAAGVEMTGGRAVGEGASVNAPPAATLMDVPTALTNTTYDSDGARSSSSQAPSLEEQALAARRLVTVGMGLEKVLGVYAASILRRATALSLVLCALLHLDAFSLLYMLLFAAVSLPIWPPRVLRGAVWHTVTAALALAVTVHFLGTVPIPPSASFDFTPRWPWDLTPEWKHFFGAGASSKGFMVIADCVALVLASLTKRQWVHSKRRLALHQSLTQGHRSGAQRSHSERWCACASGASDQLATRDFLPSIRGRVQAAHSSDTPRGWLLLFRVVTLRNMLVRWHVRVQQERFISRLYARSLAKQLMRAAERDEDLGAEDDAGTAAGSDAPSRRSRVSSRSGASGGDTKSSLSAADVAAVLTQRSLFLSKQHVIAQGAASPGSPGGRHAWADVDLREIPQLSASTELASSWDALQYYVARYSVYVLLTVLFLVVALQQDQDVINGGYFCFALWYLYHPTRLMQKGNSRLRWLRLYNFAIIVLQVVYQVPVFQPPPDSCALRSTCFAWQTLLGLQKLRVQVVQGAAPCLAPGADTAGDASLDNSACPSPFSWDRGLMPSLLVMLLGTAQAFVFDSSAYHYVLAHMQREEKLAAIRAQVAQLMQRRRREDAAAAAAAEAVQRKVRLRKLVTAVGKWENMMAGQDAGMEVDGNGEPLWPPPPPTEVQVQLLTPTSVRLVWRPPRGYTGVEQSGMRLLGDGTTRIVGTPGDLRYAVAVEQKRGVLFGNFHVSPWTQHGAVFLELNNLQPLFRYDFKVVARSKVGIGMYSDAISVTLPHPASSPGAFPVTVTQHHVRVGATRPTVDDSEAADDMPTPQAAETPTAGGAGSGAPEDAAGLESGSDSDEEDAAGLESGSDSDEEDGDDANSSGESEDEPEVEAEADSLAAAFTAAGAGQSPSRAQHAGAEQVEDGVLRMNVAQRKARSASVGSAASAAHSVAASERSAGGAAHRAPPGAAAPPPSMTLPQSNSDSARWGDTIVTSTEQLAHMQVEHVDPVKLVPLLERCVGRAERRQLSNEAKATPLGPRFTVSKRAAVLSGDEEDAAAKGRVVRLRWPQRLQEDDYVQPEDRTPTCCCYCCDECLHNTRNGVVSGVISAGWFFGVVLDWLTGKLFRTIDRTLFPRPVREFHLAMCSLGQGSEVTAAAEGRSDVLKMSFSLRLAFMLCVSVQSLLSHTGILVGLAATVNVMVYASLPSVLVMLAYTLGILWQYPRPHPLLWDSLLVYLMLLLAVKFGAQLPSFCLALVPNAHGYVWEWRAFGQCGAQGVPDYRTAAQFLQPLDILGLTKYGEEYGGSGFFAGVLWDSVLLGAVLLHKSLLQTRGMWLQSTQAKAARKAAVAGAAVEMASPTAAGAPIASYALQAGRGGAYQPPVPPPPASHGAQGADKGGLHVQTTPPAAGPQHLPRTDDDDLEEAGCCGCGGKPLKRKPATALAEVKVVGPEQRSSASPLGDATGTGSAEFEDEQADEPCCDTNNAFGRCCVRSGDAICWYFCSAIDPDITTPPKPGRDLYLWVFILQLFTLLYVMFAYNYIADAGGAGGLSEELSYNQLQSTMVLAVIGIVLWMVLERLAYLLRSPIFKMILQLGIGLSVHVVFFFAIPLRDQMAFQDNAAFKFMYLLLLLYLILGGLQMHYGYGRGPVRNSLMDVARANAFIVPFNLFVAVFMAIPFLLELRSLLDWVAARTSLTALIYLRVENVKAMLVQNQSRAAALKRNRRKTSGLDPQNCCDKCWSGIFLLVLLIIVIILPLVIFSGLNPTLEPNPVQGATVRVQLQGDGNSFPLFSTSQFASLLPAAGLHGYWSRVIAANSGPSRFTSVTPAQEPLAQLLTLYPFSASPWDVNPPTVDNLADLLGRCTNSSANVTMSVVYTFERDHPSDNTEPQGSSVANLTPAQCNGLRGAITQATTAPALAVDVPFNSSVTVVPASYPMVLRLPGVGGPVGLPSVRQRSVGLQLFRNNVLSDAASSVAERAVGAEGGVSEEGGGEAVGARRPAGLGVSLWWTVTNQDSLGYDVSGGAGAPAGGLQIGLVSDKLPPELLTSTLGASGILAMYLTIVLTVGRLARTSLTPPVEDAVYTDMPQCKQLVELAEGIDVARTAEYEGHLRDETRLYQVLLKLLRSPTILLRITADPDSPSGGSA